MHWRNILGKGFLRVSAISGTQALPVVNATYAIKDSSGTVLFSGSTDESGQSIIYTLDAPDASLGLSPRSGALPYSTYTVWVSKTGFTPVNHTGVQVFDGQTTLVTAELLPSGVSRVAENTVVTTPQSVLLPTQSNGQNGTNEILGTDGVALPGQSSAGVPENSRVLGSPVVPEIITVHIGTPSASGQNIRVPFIDYVKNVTCSEILPTWPTNAIIANIHVIVTFALNRIYTEWYRSRGYNFDITNSTQYDQYFVPNREIFANISELVDGLFNTYVRRAGFRNPFFTSFCNGTSSTCDGLSQWGTVDLAEQGMSPIEILRYYYVPDIALSVAPYGQIESYPGTALELGSSGDAVQTIQLYLNRIRQNYPLIPIISNPNGTFDAETQQAVKVFQKVFNLTQDGVVGRSTWNQIHRIYVAVVKLAELDSEGEKIGLNPTPPNITIKQGNRGADVLHAQYLLSYISNFYDNISDPGMDSEFGPVTTQSVREFQREVGLPADGIIGPTTWVKLYEVYKRLRAEDEDFVDENRPTTPPAGSPAYPGYLLKQGQRGSNVLTLQKLLNNARSVYPNIPHISEDNIFGPGTYNAVRIFQQATGLAVDGIVGQQTWNRLVSIGSNSGSATGIMGTTPVFPGVLKLGQKSDSVATLQELLNQASSRYPSIARITVDGQFGSRTQQAVRAFQQAVGIHVDGIVGQQTWGALVTTNQNRNIANNIQSTMNNAQLWGNSNFGNNINYMTNTNYPTSFGVGRSNNMWNINTNQRATINMANTAFPGNMSLHMHNNGVLQVQRLINAARTVYPTLPLLTEDGIFGPVTQQAIRQFQQLVGLSIDGVVGLQTWNALNNVQNSGTTTSPHLGAGLSLNANQLTQIPQFPGNISLHMHNNNVLHIQRLINSARSMFPNLPQLTEDGLFGVNTQNAIRMFQQLMGLPTDGIVGLQTWNALHNIQSSPTTTPHMGVGMQQAGTSQTTTTQISFPGDMRINMRGNGVLQLQRILNAARTVFPTLPVVVEDGIFGTITQQAVRIFQQLMGLPVDGVVGLQTWNALHSLGTTNTVQLAMPQQQLNLTNNSIGMGLQNNVGSTMNNWQNNAQTNMQNDTNSLHQIDVSQTPHSSILELQRLLNLARQIIPTLPQVTENGLFDITTQQAIRVLQQHFGLPIDGIVNLSTWNVLQDLIQNATSSSAMNGNMGGVSASGTNTAFGTVSPSGSNTAFNAISPSGTNTMLSPNGTNTALGMVSPSGSNTTFNAISPSGTNTMLSASGTNTNITIDDTIPPFPGVLMLNSTGSNVLALQQMLNNAATIHPNLQRVMQNGIYDMQTQNAVRTIQQLSGLTVDGIVGPQTWNVIALIQ